MKLNRYKFDCAWHDVGRVVQAINDTSMSLNVRVAMRVSTLGPGGGNPVVTVETELDLRRALRAMLEPDSLVEDDEVFDYEEISMDDAVVPPEDRAECWLDR